MKCINDPIGMFVLGTLQEHGVAFGRFDATGKFESLLDNNEESIGLSESSGKFLMEAGDSAQKLLQAPIPQRKRQKPL